MEKNIYLELFGYLGTALVILSMLMTDLNKLRILNISGAIISMIYAICVDTMPVVVLNATLATINITQLILKKINKNIIKKQIAEAEQKTKTEGDKE